MIRVLAAAAALAACTGHRSRHPEPPPLDPRLSLVEIPGGRFTAGDERGEPGEEPRALEVAPFSLMRTEVTNAQFAAFVAATGHVTDAERAGAGHVWWRHDDGETRYRWRVVDGADWRHPYGPGSDLAGAEGHAVVQVSARDAEAYCAHHGLRLPSEEEWEWAARGRDGRRYVWGDGAPSATPRARRGNVGSLRCCAPDDGDGWLRVGAVGGYPEARAWSGVDDLVGNVWEWTASEDAGHPGKRVIRGAGWGNSAWCLRAAYRHRNPPERGLDMVGFRCAR